MVQMPAIATEKQLTLSSEEKTYVNMITTQAKNASFSLRAASGKQKNNVLLKVAQLLDDDRSNIKNQNEQDIENFQTKDGSQSMIDRLSITDKEIDGMIQSLNEIVNLKDPIGEVITGWKLPNGLFIQKTRIPIGVLAVIYESRPNVTIDVGALAIKSSNAVILRGGKEAIQSNQLLASLFQKALSHCKLPAESLQLVKRTSRHLMVGFLERKDHIDLVVPRGGEGLIQFVNQNSLIPVVKHDKGVCHVYIHRSANPEIALNVLLNSKTQKPGVCNAAECVILDEGLPFMDKIIQGLIDAGVILHADQKTRMILKKFPIKELNTDGYSTEYLSMDISVKIVRDFKQSLDHINTYGSLHSEAIIAQDYNVIDQFLTLLDSAALFVNSSTRFHDGGQFGLGAEVGIATGKLHARGPMGLADLTTTKYLVYGEGQIRS